MSATARGLRTRRRILESTAQVFDEQGYAGATLNRLVESTGLTRGAFYFHFESKDALAVAIAEEQAARWQQLREQVEAQEPDPLRRLVTLICYSAHAFRNDPTTRATTRLLLDRGLIERELPQTAPWWRACMTGYLRQAESEGQLRDLSVLRLQVAPGETGGGVDQVVGYLLSQLAGIGLMKARPDVHVELQYTTWAILLPRICADPHQADVLSDLARELLLVTAPSWLPTQSR